MLRINHMGKVKDVNKRYFLRQTRKLRVEQDWLDQTLVPFKDVRERRRTQSWPKRLVTLLFQPLSAIKGHPLYVIKRHLLKFEAVYPFTAPTLFLLGGLILFRSRSNPSV